MPENEYPDSKSREQHIFIQEFFNNQTEGEIREAMENLGFTPKKGITKTAEGQIKVSGSTEIEGLSTPVDITIIIERRKEQL